MKNALRIFALIIALAAAGTWLATGANRGWTKTTEAKKILDEVTGIEGIAYERRFSPGLDFLGVALLGSTVLAGVSSVFRNKPTSNPTQPD